MLPNFQLSPRHPVSQAFLQKEINTFHGVINYIHQLPYGRNTDKTEVLIALKEERGTCGTKHALLAELAAENGYNDISLTLGVYKMCEANMPGIGNVLAPYKLPYMPEAHNYLTYRNRRYDYTFAGRGPDFTEPLLFECPMQPQHIGDQKISIHKDVLKRWLDNEKLPYTLDEIYAIREACIAQLSSN